ncbi:hypothetical protein PENTCL1PPCAC_4378, partial [Pristionchus entomophagus]
TDGQLLPLELASLDHDIPEPTSSSPEMLLRPPHRDVYDDDHSDYEDNLQGKLEVVADGRSAHLSDEEEEAIPPFAFSITSMRSEQSSNKDPLSIKRLQARRDSTRMDEMTTRRSSVGSGRRNSVQPTRRFSVFPFPDSVAATGAKEDEQDSSFSSSYDHSFKNSYLPFDKSYGGNLSNLSTLKEVPSRSDIKIEITEPIEEEPSFVGGSHPKNEESKNK